MSVIRPRPPADPILFVAPADAPPPADRSVTLPADVPGSQQAMAAVMEGPARLLADYRMERPTRELYAMLQLARRLRDHHDRVIVAAAAGEVAAVRAILETCCHPFHDQLPRADRGGRPRLSFTGSRFSNDVDQGLLDLVAPPGRPPGGDLLDRWALLVMATGVLPTSVAASARLFLRALAAQAGLHTGTAIDRVATVGAPLEPLATALGCPTPFPVPAGSEGAGAVFTAVALLPAAIAGVDVVRLLEGAVAMNMRFQEAPFDDNPVRRFLAGHPLGCPDERRHRLTAADERLAAVVEWFEAVQDATQIIAAPAAQVRLVVEEPRRDLLTVPPPAASTPDGDGLPLDDIVGLSWTALAKRDAKDHSAPEIRLPRVDEHAIGQLLQMLLLVTRASPNPAANPRPDPGSVRVTSRAHDAGGRSMDGSV